MTIRTGVQAPYQYVLNLTADGTIVDLADVTDAELDVRLPNYAETETWDVALSNQTTTTLTLTHTFDVDDAVEPGAYVIFAKLTVPGGILRSDPKLVRILDQFDPSQ